MFRKSRFTNSEFSIYLTLYLVNQSNVKETILPIYNFYKITILYISSISIFCQLVSSVCHQTISVNVTRVVWTVQIGCFLAFLYDNTVLCGVPSHLELSFNSYPELQVQRYDPWVLRHWALAIQENAESSLHSSISFWHSFPVHPSLHEQVPLVWSQRKLPLEKSQVHDSLQSMPHLLYGHSENNIEARVLC